MYEQSHRDYLRRSAYRIIVCLSWLLIITVITPLPTKPSATKCRRTEAGGNAAITGMYADASQRDVAALMQNTRRS